MRLYVIASILIILGLIVIAYKGTLPAEDWKLPYLNDLSSALLVAGLLSLLFRIFQDRHHEEGLRRLMRIHDSVDELGLAEIVPQAQGYDFTTVIKDTINLSIVMNDGARWIGNNSVSLKERFGRKTTTELFTVDPDGPFVESLAAKTSVAVDDLKRKIRESWNLIEATFESSTKKGALRIYRLNAHPTRSLFLSENVLIETPYQIASGRTNVPVYIYSKVARRDSPYWFAHTDIEALRNESILEKELAPPQCKT